MLSLWSQWLETESRWNRTDSWWLAEGEIGRSDSLGRDDGVFRKDSSIACLVTRSAYSIKPLCIPRHTIFSDNVELDNVLASVLVVQDSGFQGVIVTDDAELVGGGHDPDDGKAFGIGVVA